MRGTACIVDNGTRISPVAWQCFHQTILSARCAVYAMIAFRTAVDSVVEGRPEHSS